MIDQLLLALGVIGPVFLVGEVLNELQLWWVMPLVGAVLFVWVLA